MAGDGLTRHDSPPRWRIRPIAEIADLEAAIAPNHDDATWIDVGPTSQWQQTDALTTEQGPVVYRGVLELPTPTPRSRRWLSIGGVFYQADVWLDGTLVGDIEGYFAPHEFEIPASLDERGALALVVSCAPQTERTRKRNITGLFQHWEQFAPTRNPGGPWRPVQVITSGPVRIRHSRITCRDADPFLATVEIRLVLDADADAEVEIATRVAQVDHRRSHRLAAGENQVTWTVGVENPALWWPRSMGDQPLHDVDVDVRLGDHLTDRVSRRVGFRSVENRNWITRVNGERLFLKGANQGPADYWLGRTTEADHRRIVETALDAGLDMVRLQSHVTHPSFYDAADEAGLVVWQDFPLQWGYHPSIRRQATRQAREMVDLLAHHPSIVLWCAHHEPAAIDPSPAAWSDSARRRRLLARAGVAQQLPAYNRTVIDRSVRRALQRCDPSRPVISHAGGLPNAGWLRGTDTHLFLGWFAGDERQLPGLAATVPALFRFLGAFGAQAAPASFAADAEDRWPGLDWEHLGQSTGLNKACFDRVVPPEDYPTAAAWVEATQHYQATVIRYHVETLRRLKYRPCGGFAVQGLVDSEVAVSFPLVDRNGTAKQALDALRDACRPLVAIADRLPDHLHLGDQVSLDVHVVNDLRRPVEDLQCRAELTWPGGTWEATWAGRVDADACVRVGRVDTVLSPAALDVAEDLAESTVELHLELTGADGVARSSYRTPLVTSHPGHHD